MSALFLSLGVGFLGATYYSPNLLSNHPFLKELADKLLAYQEYTSKDKVYLHFDKKFVEPGETLWFNAYIRDAKTFQPSIKSEVVYVELLSPKGSVEKSLTLIAQEGLAAGEFELPKTMKGGLYKVKAYTKWQQNNNTFFERTITVQKSVLPNLNMELNFERKAYGVGEKVAATLDLNSLTKEPLAHHLFNFVVSLDGQTVKNGENKTDAKGRANIQFDLPKNLETNDGLLNVMIQYKGQTESISRSIPIVLGNVDLKFYAEGGELIEGMICGMGFKALNEFGQPADIKGNIIDQNNKVVATFDSYHQGMGKFEFAPQAGNKYFAQLTSPANISKSYPLPTALKKGYTLKMHNQNAHNLDLEVISSENEELYLVAQSGNQVYFSKDFQARTGLNRISIPTTDFPIGITQITLFDSKKIARAERLAFINKGKQLNIKVITDKEKYLPREKVNMTLEVTDERGMPMAGNFSLAVVDDKLLTFADDKQGHLLSYMLLESDLQGELVEPNFYFDNENDATRLKPEVNRSIALDHLLMTQGWRKFTWEEIQNQKFTPNTQAGELATFAGTVLNAQGQPIDGADVVFVGKDKKQITDNKGVFNIRDWKLYETATMEVSAPNYYPITMALQDYNSKMSFTLYKKRIITGTVKAKNGGHALSDIYVNAAGVPTIITDKDGKFSIVIPENINTLTFYGGAYNGQNVTLKDNVNDLKVVLDDMTIYPASITSAEVRSAGGLHRDAVKGNVNLKDAWDRKEKAEINRAAENKKQLDDFRVDDADPAVIEDMPNVELEDIELNIEDDALGGEVFEELAVGDWDGKVAKNDLGRRDAIVVSATRYYRARTFAEVRYEDKQTPTTRTDFRKTIYWNPNVVVDKSGKAALTFYNSDDITQFRVTVEGFSKDGGLGRIEQKYFTQLPVEMLAKVPREVLTGDKINIPLTFTNNTDDLVEGKLEIAVPTHIKLLQTPPSTVKLGAGKSETILLACEVLNEVAAGDFKISFQAAGLSDQFTTIIDARPRGFPVNEVFTGDQLTQQFNLVLQEAMEGSVVAKLQAYPSTIDEVMKGMESMLRMPGGCFEQTSSSNYPNLLVLDYLRETGTSMPTIEEQAKGYLSVGYQRLVGYESQGGGFDWWGRSPAHEALTAYGLMQFVDMKAVYPVDAKLIERTATWLLSRKDGKGSWTKNPNALHSWAVAEVTDAYIVWALTEAGYSSEIKKELDKSYNDAVKSEDPYMMSLVAIALYNAKDSRANSLATELVKLQQKDGKFVGLTSSVTNSTGESLMIETTSLAALVMMQAKNYPKQLASAMRCIQNGKSYYGYGSTQGTVLALKAMLEFAKSSKRAAESGELAVYIDNKKVTSVVYKADEKEILIPNFAKFLKAGKQHITVKYEQTKTAMPFDLELTYTTRLPQNSAACKLALKTELPKSKVNMGETVRLTTTLTNITKDGQPMTMAMVGIPAGLSLQPWQLKELQDKKIVDYYELFDGYVVFHYEQLLANETKVVHLDLKADIPGQYEAPASSAFLYYTNEHRVWAMPERMTIN